MVILIFLVATFVPPAVGQGANEPARIIGRVVAAENGHPLRGAVVELIGGSGSQSLATDAEGRFEFKERRVGSYSLRASKASYVSNVFGGSTGEADQFNVLAGQRIDRGTVRLQRASVISGRVVDEFGEPISDASVVAYRIEFPQPGIRSWQAIKEVPTNDLGEYRIHGLMPGQYYVSASRSPLAPEFRLPPAVELEHAIMTGGSVASARSASEPIVVDTMYAGETGGMNLTLKHTRRVRVAGTVVDSNGRPSTFASVTLRLAQSIESPLDAGSAVARTRAGEFVFTNVPVGEYRLTATADIPRPVPSASGYSASPGANAALSQESASISISVTDDISGLNLQTSPVKSMPAVTGRVFIDGTLAETATRLRYVMLPAGQYPMVPRRAGDGSIVSSFPRTRPGPPGRFIIPGVNGLIVLRYTDSSGLSLKSVTANGVDVTDGFEVMQSDVTVDVHLTAQGPVLKGVVKDADGTVAADGEVVLFSVEPAYWRAPLSRRMATVGVDDKGAFQVTSLPAGEYVAVALTGLDRAMWADPVRLEQLRPFATPFSLADATTTTIALVVKR
jgi:protocatechuate 3,4-dioxygenase beta subunit